MKRILIKFVLFGCFIGSALVSCQKKNPINVDYAQIYMNSKIKPLCFKPGSYWVYTRDSGSVSDCTYVSKVNSGFYEVGTGQNRISAFEFYSMVINSSVPGLPSSFTNHIETTVMLLNPKVGYPSAWGPLLFSVNTLQDFSHYPSDNSIIDSLIVNNKTFYKVQSSTFPLNGKSVTFYTTLTDGIIKMTVPADSLIHDWNLIRYKIVN